MRTRPGRLRDSGLLTTACLGVVLAGTIAGCSGSSSGGANAGSTTTPTTSVASSPAAAPASLSASATATGQAVRTALNPCDLVTRSEASALAGATFGPGQESANGAGKRCVYGSKTLNVFTVEVVQAKDATTATAAWNEAQTEAKSVVKQQLPAGLTLSLNTDSVDIGDKAATVTGSTSLLGHSFGFSGVYVLKGPTFFAFQDLLLSKAPPAVSRMEDQARTTLGRVS